MSVGCLPDRDIPFRYVCVGVHEYVCMMVITNKLSYIDQHRRNKLQLEILNDLAMLFCGYIIGGAAIKRNDDGKHGLYQARATSFRLRAR